MKTGRPHSAINQGFQLRDNTIYTVGSDTWQQEVLSAINRVSEINSYEADKVNFRNTYVIHLSKQLDLPRSLKKSEWVS